MPLILTLQTLLWCAWVLLVGLMVGSFLNVLIARLPYQQSIIWPGSRCRACLQPIRLRDNIPILGYLFLQGRCRTCGSTYSSRYLWVELLTGLAFLGLFVYEVVLNVPGVVGMAEASLQTRITMPPIWALLAFAYHAVLLSLLIAASFVDLQHRMIPPLITYGGTLLGLMGAILVPWPWPGDSAVANDLQSKPVWFLPEDKGGIPLGWQPWPFWGPLPEWASPGSGTLGFLNGLLGALAGMVIIRTVKFLFEVGLGREALGLGDADLMMMAGAFLGWQIIVTSLFVGCLTALAFKIPWIIIEAIRRRPYESELPFGPGLALGVVITWLAWRWIGPSLQFLFFDEIMLALVALIMGGGMLGAGLILRRPQAG